MSTSSDSQHRTPPLQLPSQEDSLLCHVATIAPSLHIAVTAWFAEYGRVFPWRSTATPQDPYITLLAECMLQQTQTARVSEKLPLFLRQFPTIQALAKADNATIIRAWQGMGYNNRALRLRDCARELVIRFNARIPDTLEELQQLPGIGTYTAQALASFAYHRDTAVIDVNIRRVYSRVFAPQNTLVDTLAPAMVQSVAEIVFPRGQSSLWHQAIMDIGALYCTAKKTKCTECPLVTHCRSAYHMKPALITKRKEPSYRGQPNRIWRGKIVELLRALPARKTLSTTTLLHKLFPPATSQLFADMPATNDREWLEGILHGLEKDGIIRITRTYADQRAIVRIALAL